MVPERVIRAFFVASALASALMTAALSACGGAVCQPDRCGVGRVCGLSGACEAAPASSGDDEALVILDEDAPLEQAYEASSRLWGTSEGDRNDEVAFGGEHGATLYLAFALEASAVDTAVLELSPSEDTTYGAPQTVEVWDVTAFEAIDVGRLPGAQFERHARHTVWQPHLRIDVSLMARAAHGVLYLAIRGRGASPGWRVATPGAADPARCPRLVVHAVAEPRDSEQNASD